MTGYQWNQNSIQKLPESPNYSCKQEPQQFAIPSLPTPLSTTVSTVVSEHHIDAISILSIQIFRMALHPKYLGEGSSHAAFN